MRALFLQNRKWINQNAYFIFWNPNSLSKNLISLRLNHCSITLRLEIFTPRRPFSPQILDFRIPKWGETRFSSVVNSFRTVANSFQTAVHRFRTACYRFRIKVRHIKRVHCETTRLCAETTPLAWETLSARLEAGCVDMQTECRYSAS